jgi:hypothetical protein
MSKYSTLLMLAKDWLALKRGKKTPRGEWVINKYFLGNRSHNPLPCCEKYYDEIEYVPRGLYEHFKSVEHLAVENDINPAELQSFIDQLRAKKRR